MTARLTIHRLDATYVVPRETPDPGAVRARLDRVIERRIVDACGDLLPQVVDVDDPGIWLIRRLELDLAVDVGALDDDVLARAWGSQIARSVARVVNGRPDGHSVIYFPSRAAYLASFLHDLANGRAWSQWYYRAFDGLRSLPDHTALREALVREPETAWDALGQLHAAGRLERVLAVLTARDVQRVLDVLLPSTGGRISRSGVAAVLEVWHAARLVYSPALHTAHNALRLVAALADRHAQSDRPPREAVERVLALAGALRAIEPDDHLIDRLAIGDQALWAALERTAGPGLPPDAAADAPAAARDDGWLWDVARTARPAGAARPRTVSPDGEVFSTPFASVFLLWPSLLDLELPALLDRLAPGDEQADDPRPALRLLISALGFGLARRAEALADPAVRLAAGAADEPLDPGLLVDAPGLPLALLEVLTYQGRIDGTCLLADLILPHRLLVLRDPRQEMWVWVARAGDLVPALAQGIAAVQAATGQPETILLPGLSLAGLLDDTALAAYVPGVTVHRGPDSALPGNLHAGLARLRTYARPPEDELPTYVAAGERFDPVLILLARAGLKLFARKLLGFEWSSPEYLYQNFLAGRGFVTRYADHLRVELPPVPLRLVLGMTGVNGQRLFLPWLDPPEVRLVLPEG